MICSILNLIRVLVQAELFLCSLNTMYYGWAFREFSINVQKIKSFRESEGMCHRHHGTLNAICVGSFLLLLHYEPGKLCSKIYFICTVNWDLTARSVCVTVFVADGFTRCGPGLNLHRHRRHFTLAHRN